MEGFSGDRNPNIGKKFITLEDGSSVEAPEGVRDEQDYKEHLAEQAARMNEATKQQEADALRAEAVKLASRIENSVDEKIVKKCLASGDYGPIFSAIAGVDGVPTKGDQIKIDQDGRKLAETHNKYDALMAEAMTILRDEYFGEAALKASEKADNAGENLGDELKKREMMLEELNSEAAKMWLRENEGRFTAEMTAKALEGDPRWDKLSDEEKASEMDDMIEHMINSLPRLDNESLTRYYDQWMAQKADEERYDAFQDSLKGEYEAKFDEDGNRAVFEKEAENGQEQEKSREEMLSELFGLEGMKWLSENGYTKFNEIEDLDDDGLKSLYEKWATRNESGAEEKETELSREEMVRGLHSLEGGKWLSEVKGIEKLTDIDNMSDEEIAGLYAEWTAYKEEQEKKKTEEEATEEELDPLVAVDIDRTRDAEAAAHDIAEKMLKEDLASGKGLKKFLKGIWKGNMFRGYYIEKNKKLAYNRILEKQRGEDSEMGDDLWQSRSEATIDRFISQYDEMIHNDAGEWRDALPEDHPATVAAKKAISEFAKGKLDEANFMEEMGRIKAMLKDKDGNPKGEVVLDNYLEIARTAKGRFEHEEGLARLKEGFEFNADETADKVMEGFRMVSGEARSGVRTEAHMNALDKVMNAYSTGRFSKFLPPELVAGAASVGLWLAQTGTTSAVRAATFGIGGAAATGVFAGLKEGARVSTDRAQAAREAASGLQYDKDGKYDKAVNSTLYEMAPAANLTSQLNEAVKSGDQNEIVKFLALADTRIKMSDERDIDLICYSDPTKIEDERFALDLARAEARVALKQYGSEGEATLNQLMTMVEKTLDEGDEGIQGIKAKDAAFKKLRRKQMIKQGVKTAAVAAGTMIVTQEVVAAFSPDSYGIADEIFNLENNADASKTMMAGLLGFKGPDGVLITGTERVDAQEAAGVKLTDEEVARLEQEGYTVNRMETTTLQSQEVDMSASEYAQEYGTPISRDDWGSNGTTAFDGNELNAHYTTNGEGIVTRMSGNSTTWGGESIDFQEAVDAGKIKAFISLTGDSQSTPIEVAGQVINNGSQLEFIPEAGSAAAECFQDGKFIGKYFEIVFDNGVAENGTQHVIPLATVVGQGLEGTINATVETPVSEVLYNVIGFERATEAIQAVGDGVPNPAALLPFVRRDNLRNARRAEGQPETPTPTEQTPEGGDEVVEGGENTPTGEVATPEEQPEDQPGDTAEEGGETTQPEESAQTEGETTPEGDSSEATAETQEAGEYDNDGEPIWENLADKIGGERGVWLVNGGMDSAPETWRNSEYQLWWDSLSDVVKDRFAQKSSDRLSPESDTLFDWLRDTGKMADAGETYGDNAEIYESTWNDMNDQQKTAIREGRFVPNNQYFVDWLRKNDIIPAEGENAAPQGEATAA